MKTKKELRQHFLQLRQAMPDTTVKQKSDRIVRLLMAKIDWTTAKTMHCFLPLEGDNEPDMRELIEEALKNGATVYTSDPSTATGRHVRQLEGYERQQQIHQYKLNDAVRFDIIIVPMIAYDGRTNHRLGFGGGFYDRLIAEQPQAKTVGVCFSECAASTLPVDSHDQPLDTIIAL